MSTNDNRAVHRLVTYVSDDVADAVNGVREFTGAASAAAVVRQAIEFYLDVGLGIHNGSDIQPFVAQSAELTSERRAVRTAIDRIGVNVNEIAHRANSGASVEDMIDEIRQVLCELKEVNHVHLDSEG